MNNPIPSSRRSKMLKMLKTPRMLSAAIMPISLIMAITITAMIHMAVMLKPEDTRAEIEIVFQSLEGMHQAIPTCPGDWYFSGNYPTPGGDRLVNQAFVNYYEGNIDRR